MTRISLIISTVVSLFATTQLAVADDDAQKLSTQLSNPLAALISAPVKFDHNSGYAGGGQQNVVTFQPVIPFSISQNWNVISRTIIPYVTNDNITPGSGKQSGFGNTTQSFFFSPKAPTKGGVIWGVGPIFQLPTAADRIAPNNWGAGVTGVVLKQKDGWTAGALVSQLWSISNGGVGDQFSATYMQPFLGYSTKKGTSFSVNTETTYEWNNDEWSIPINVMVGQVFKVGKQHMQLTGGARYWAKTTTGGPDGWGARLQLTFMFPK